MVRINAAGCVRIVSILITALFTSCTQPNKEKKKEVKSDAIIQDSIPITIEAFLINTLENGIDATEFNAIATYGYFKSGHFLDKNNSHALTITYTKDSTYAVRIYQIRPQQLILLDSIEGLEASPSEFYITYADYNFDGQTDMFIEVSKSTDFLFYSGHLVTIDPKSKKFIQHPEARELANLKPDSSARVVFSEEPVSCRYTGKKETCKWTNEWVNGRLTTTKKDCPCEAYQQPN